MRLQRLFKISSSFILCVVLFLPCVVSAGPLDNWHQRTFPAKNALFAVTYGDGNFIAVGVGGSILTSPDGIIWTERRRGDTLSLSGAAYGNNMFLVADYYAYFMTSPDGISWTEPLSPYHLVGSAFIRAVTYGNGIFIAVGYHSTYGIVLKSTDGINWTPGNSDTQHSLTVPKLDAAAYGNGQFVAVGESGTVLTSPDGTTWTERNSGSTVTLNGVTYGNGTFVAVGDIGAVLTSSDGANWIERNSETTSPLYEIAYGGGIYAAVGLWGTILTSPDGTTWTERNSGTTRDLNGVTYGNGTFVVVGSPGIIITSSDGINWIVQGSGTPYDLTGITSGNGISVAVGHRGTILTSSDGANWIERNSETTSPLYEITYGNGTFVAVGGSNSIMTSSDSINWTSGIAVSTAEHLRSKRHISEFGTNKIGEFSGIKAALGPPYICSPINLFGATYGNGTFVIVGHGVGPTTYPCNYYGLILTSYHLTSWVERSPGTASDLHSVAYGDGTFVAVGQDGTVLSSSPRSNWVEGNSGVTETLYGVTYGDGTFVAVGEYGTILSSYGSSWVERYSGITETLYGVVYGYGTFVAVGQIGTILTSPDGINWILKNSGITDNLNSVAYSNGTFIAVGDHSTILQSDPLREGNPPTGSIVINGGAEATKSTSATLTLTASDDGGGAIQMCISNTTSCTSWSAFAATKSWTLLAGSGTKTVYVWFRDQWGNTNPTPYSDTIILDTTAPTNGTVTATPGNTQVTVNWSGFSDAQSGIDSYKVVYATSYAPYSCSSGTALYTGTDTSYPHTGLTNGTTYGYRVCAIDKTGNMSSGATAAARPVP